MPKPRSSYPSEQTDKFLVRLPDGMRDRIAEAAKANGRSMNAEIVTRLEGTFADEDRGHDIAMSALTLHGLMESMKSLAARPLHPTSENTVYVILDTDGMPISWNEIYTHLGELNRAAGMSIASQQSFIITPQMISSTERETEELRLITEYAKRKRAARKARKATIDSTGS